MIARITIRDVARKAGVAVGTVSRVLNDHGSVSPDLRHKVGDAIRSLGYEPNAVARSMRVGATRTVACAIRDISTTGFGDFVKAAEERLRERGYTLILANTDERPDREIELIRTFTTRQVDGIIMTISAEEDAVLGRAIAAAPVPLVLMDRDAGVPADVAAIDHRGGARRATAHLIGLGHRRIALVTGQPTMRPAHERIAGFWDAFGAAGLEPDPDLVRTGGFTAAFGFAATTALLDRAPPPTAVIAGGMAMLPGVLRAVRERGLLIPRDISIVAGADTDLAALAHPAITAVRWDNAAWGRTAVELLLDRMAAGPDGQPRRETIETELVERESCGLPGPRGGLP